MKKVKVIVIGALENGKIVIDYLSKRPEIDLLKVYTYKDGVALAKPLGVLFDDVVPQNILVKVDHINEHEEEIKSLNPDLIFIVGWSQLINPKIITASKKGTIGFHPAKLPKDRGRSVLAWQIAEDYPETALTMFYIDEGIDSGDIIAQENIKISFEDYILDILKKVNEATYNLLAAYFPLLLQGKAPRIKQDSSKATYRRLRTDKDSFINWYKNTKDIYNLIRAVAYPYPKAWTIYKGKRVKINKAAPINFLEETLYKFEKPGTILGHLKNLGYLVKTKDGIISVDEIEFEDRSIFWETGKVLGK